MKNSGSWLVLLIIIMLGYIPARGASGGNSDFLNKIISSYQPWSSVELNGKLHMSRLPLSPSIRIFMQKGQKIYISVRAPFLGEVGRVDIDGTQLTAVNKMKKIYVREDLSEFAGKNLPVTVGDLQDLFLGRVFLAGEGTLYSGNMHLCTVYDESDCWLLVPTEQPAQGSVRYGYTLDSSAQVQDLYVTTISGNYSALAEYFFQGSKTIIDFNLQLASKNYDAKLQLDAPKWNPSKHMDAVEINNSWQAVRLGTFIKSF